MDRLSKRILAAWIASDIIWAALFIRARQQAERREAKVRPTGSADVESRTEYAELRAALDDLRATVEELRRRVNLGGCAEGS